jgi:Bacterial type II secretion system protein N.
MTFSKILTKPVVITFLIVYFLYLVVSRAPAEIAASAIHNAVPHVWLTGVEGTLWNGVANGSQLDMGKDVLPLGRVTWQLSGWSLLLLRPCIQFATDGGALMASGNVCQGIAGVTGLTDVSVDAPVSSLSELLQLPISGQGSVQIISAELKGTDVQKLDARLSWQKGSVNPENTGWVNVGSYGANLKENGSGGVTASIFDIAAPVKTELEADITFSGWTIEGKVEPQANAPEILAGGVQLIGEEVEPGIYHIVWSSN